MQITLDNDDLQCVIDTYKATWSLFSRTRGGPFIEDATIRVQYKRGFTRFRALHKWQHPRINTSRIETSRHGPMQIKDITIGPDKNNLEYTLTYAMPENHPLLFWKLKIHNQGKRSVRVNNITLMNVGHFRKGGFLPKGGLTLVRSGLPEGGHGVIRPHQDPGESAFFSNGWQSWSNTGSYRASERYLGTRLGIFGAPMWNNPYTPIPKTKGRFVSEMFGVLGDLTHRSGILIGFLSQKQNFGSLEVQTDSLYPAVRLWANGDNVLLNAGSQIMTDWAVIDFIDIDAEDPLGNYINAVSREHDIELKEKDPTTGWCSWYQYFQNITANDINHNVQTAQNIKDALPLNLMQIDDGFERKVGDWLETKKGFPDGVAPLASEIRKSGFTPGLWLAPFIVHPRSKLLRKHYSWLLKNKYGMPVNAGFIWNAFDRALDLTNPPALDYVRHVIHTAVHEWGYSYLKLDFLYAAALSGRYKDATKTRAQVLRQGLEAIREVAGAETTLLGCGCPLGSAIGLMDAMRIGPDVATNWFPQFEGHQLLFRREPSMPAARNAIHNTITRSAMHKRWWINDPDCLLLRPQTNLSLSEVQTLASAIAMSGGSLLLSDKLDNLPPERIRIAQSLLPLIGKRPRVTDWFDASNPRFLRVDLENTSGLWVLLGIFNWSEQPIREDIPLSKFFLESDKIYYAHSFWDGTTQEIRDGIISLENIPPHSTKLIALRTKKEGASLYLGSNLHVSQGLEIINWQENDNQLTFTIKRPFKMDGFVDLNLKRKVSKTSINQIPVDIKTLDNQIYRLPISFNEISDVTICFV